MSFKQGTSSAAITYTVNALTLNQTYYFRVRANNGCAPGNWSRVLGVYIGDPNSPTSTPSGSLLPSVGSNVLTVVASVGGISILTGIALVMLF
ncbi:MAG: hypothetical protein ACREBJ_04705 [Nitrosotalea sp.]